MFSFFKKSSTKTRSSLSSEEKHWVHQNLLWFSASYSLPSFERAFVQPSAEHFPASFDLSSFDAGKAIHDLCALLALPADRITFSYAKDLRDVPNLPYEISEAYLETTLAPLENGYHIYIAQAMQQSPARLLHQLTLDLVQVKLLQGTEPFEDVDLRSFRCLMAIFFGLGVVVGQKMVDVGHESDFQWSRNWNYTSDISPQIMTYAMACFSLLYDDRERTWKSALANEDQTSLHSAFVELEASAEFGELKNEIKANQCLVRANAFIEQRAWNEAVALFKQALSITQQAMLQAMCNNNIGYYLFWQKAYAESLPYFEAAIASLPSFAYAYDNRGYALIHLGRLEEGRASVEQAMALGTNEPAYSYRNMALYYAARSKRVQAEAYFQKAFAAQTFTVDWLEEQYQAFLAQASPR